MWNLAQSVLIEILAPLVVVIFGIVGSIALGYAKRKWGIEIEAKHREAMHQALETGARAVAARYGLGPTGTITTAAINEVIEYAKRSTPDAMAKLNPPQSVATNLATAALQRVLGLGT